MSPACPGRLRARRRRNPRTACACECLSARSRSGYHDAEPCPALATEEGISMRRSAVALAAACAVAAFSAASPAPLRAQSAQPVYAVLFTHIEDATPGGTLGTVQSRNNYLLYRGGL